MKIDGTSVDHGFVRGLSSEPSDMVVAGSTLSWVDGDSAHQISVEGGGVTDVIPPSLGFTSLNSVGLAADGSPVFEDDYGMSSVSGET